MTRRSLFNASAATTVSEPTRPTYMSTIKVTSPAVLRSPVIPVVRPHVANAETTSYSDLSSGITGETLHVDCGYHIMGGPPLDAIPAKADA